jgi:hypothetical protein
MQQHGDFVFHLLVFVTLLASQILLYMKKQMEITGSKVWAEDGMN